MTVNTSLQPIVVNTPFAKIPADDPRVVVRADLQSLSGLDGGVLTDANSVATFNGNGISNGTEAYVRWTPTAAEVAALAKSSLIHLEIESDFLTSDFTGADRLLNLANGNRKIYMTANQSFVVQWDTTTTSFLTKGINTDRPWKSHTDLDFVIQGNNVKTYIDGLLMFDETNDAAQDFTTITLFAAQNGTQKWGEESNGACKQRVKNLYIVSGVIPEVYHKNLSSLHIYGDSIIRQGNLVAGWPDANGTAGSGWADEGMTAAIQKACRKVGLRVVVQNKGIGGDTLADVQARIDVTPHLAGAPVVIKLGVNNLRPLGVLDPIQSIFKTDYQTLIDDITALGADHIFVCTIASTAEDSTAPESLTRGAVDEVNQVVTDMENENANVTKIDVGGFLGGANFDAANYAAANLHFNRTGSRKVGEFIGANVLSYYNI